MGILSRMERARVENPKVPLSSHNISNALTIDQPSASGVTVNHDKAMGITAFWAGVRLISQTIAGLPCQVFERKGKESEPAVDHPVYRLLYTRPNPMMTPFTFKEIRAAHCLTWGNSYAEIEYDKGGRPIALWPLLPDRTGAEIVNGDKKYYTYVDSTKVWLSADRVLHVPGLGFDGIKGYNVVKVHRDSLGLSIASNDYGAGFFSNSGRPSGILKHPGHPDEAERQQFREEWNQMHSGLTKQQRTAVLWGNMEWQAISVPPEEAQFLQTREMQIEEIARILNINPILLQHYTKATTWGSGIAQFLTAYAKFTITPWLEREEDVLDWDLFSDNERGRYYVKYNINALLRGDAESQAKVLEIKRRNGVINADEWRELDEENPLPDGQGKEYFMPLNMAPVSQMLEREPKELPTPQRNKRTLERRSMLMRQRLRNAHLGAFEDAARRYVKRDAESLERAINKAFERNKDPANSLNRWIEEFYPTQERYIYQTMLPMVAALASTISSEAAEEVNSEPEEIEAFAQSYTENLARREVGSSIGQIRTIIEEEKPEELQEALSTRASEWTEKRPGKVAANEIVRVSSGAARFVWGAAGVSYLVWRANPGACPLCQQMDGKRVGINEYFLTPGESVTDGDRPGGIVAESNVGGPPLHGGCVCDISPE